MIRHQAYKKFIFLLGLVSFYAVKAQDNRLTYENDTYTLVKGIEELYKKDVNHSSSQLNFTDGEFYQTQVWISGNINLIYRARKASIWVYVDLYAPGDKGLTSGSYKFMPRRTDENTPELADTHFFKKGKLAIDLNKNGKLDKKIEFFTITEGAIKLEVLGKQYALQFSFVLENGAKVTGNFTTDFDQL